MNAFVHDALPGRIIFGAGAVAQVPSELRALGVRAALVISDAQAKSTADGIAAELGDGCVGVLAGVRQHVPEELAADARSVARDTGADGVVTIGGGSATGLGKAVAVELGIPLLAVPTTYAGSEVTPIYGLTGRRKVTARDPRALPRVVVYDPELTLSLPAEVAGPSGLNAMAHCVEAFYGPGTNPVVALLAEEGIRWLARALPAIIERPDDLDARSEALYGSYLAGAALAVAGTALHHKVCHVLGGSFGLPHGPVNAVMLPYVMAYNGPAVPEAMARIAAALGGRGDPTGAPAAMAALTTNLGAPTSLAALGMPADGLEAVAEMACADVGSSNPRPVDVASLLALLKAAYDGLGPAQAGT